MAKAQSSQAKKSAGMPIGHGVGRRKSAVARVWLRRGKGNILVNGKDYKQYFDTEITRMDAYRPFVVVPDAGYDVEANVEGGGVYAQADAISLGISRAMVELNQEIKSVLRKAGLLTCDSRVKERKKPGQKAARRKFQFVKR